MTERRSPGDEEATRVTRIENSRPDPQGILPQGVILGRYIILSVLGSGGMGVVYAAYDPELERKVALKLLHRATDSMDQTRLLNEARILARLSHPNVLPVFDVGRYQDQLFLAMEYVPGQNLRQWEQEQPRGWRHTLKVFLAAARGLAAAHQARVIHRDFKPQNAMIGKDGRVRVMDFGISWRLEKNAGPTADSLSGTLSYMAPEQIETGIASFLSDQYSFGVALFEGLYGSRPFQGKTAGELLEATRQPLRFPEVQHKVPKWLQKILGKALHADPSQRFGDMRELIAALEDDPAIRRKRWLAGASVSGLAWMAGWGLFNNQQSTPQPCSNAADKFAGIWDDARKARVEQALKASALPSADTAFNTISTQLDGYRRAWIDTFTQSCKATRIQGEQSERLLDLRNLCLERRRQEVKSLVTLLSTADAITASKAVKSVGNLSPVADCSNQVALNNKAPLPGSPAIRASLEIIETELAKSKALKDTGHYQQSLEIARSQLAQAASTRYAPVLALAHYRVADALDYLGQDEQANPAFKQAFIHAIEGGDDRMAAKTAAAQVWVTGHVLNQPETAASWGEYGQAFLRRMGGDTRIEADLLGNLGTVAQDQGNFDQALALAEQVLKLRVQAYGEVHERTMVALVNLANAKRMRGDLEQARRLNLRALDISRKTQGAEHPSNVTLLYNLGGLMSELGKPQEAYQYNRQAVDLALANYGSEHYESASAIANLAEAEYSLGRYQDSLGHYQGALPVLERYLGKQHPRLLSPLTGIASVLIDLQRPDEARPYIEQAQSIIADKTGQEYPRSILLLLQAKIALLQEKDPKKARALAQAALAQAKDAGSRARMQLQSVREFLHEL